MRCLITNFTRRLSPIKFEHHAVASNRIAALGYYKKYTLLFRLYLPLEHDAQGYSLGLQYFYQLKMGRHVLCISNPPASLW